MMKGRFTIVLTLLLLTSCSEFLVVEPDKQVSITEQFSTRDGVMEAVNGMYKKLEDLVSWKQFVFADLMGGNINFSPAENDYVIEFPAGFDTDKAYDFKDEADDSDFESMYNDCYSLINAANTIIEQTSDSQFLTLDEIAQISAEALAVRAYGHYVVALHYAQNYSYAPDASHPGIVYNQQTLIAGVDYPSRLSMKETYELMKEDFMEALSLFGDEQAQSLGPNYTYFNSITCASVFARVALQMNDWETAWIYADSVIQNAGISLMAKDDYIAEWEKPEDPVSEVIFELSAPRTSEGDVSSSVAYSYYSYVDQTNYNEFVASGDLLELYDTIDIRKDMFIEAWLPTSVNGIVADSLYFFTKKFQDDPGTPMTRLSEMYLIRAEAAARLGGEYEGQALIDLNRLRYRAGLKVLTSNENILEEIFLERRRELAFEGFLFYDLARYHKNIVRDAGCISSVCNLDYPSDFYILPIPKKSVDLNENMEQNEGY